MASFPLINSRHSTFLGFCYCTKQINVSFLWVCPLFDGKFRHNIDKVSCGTTRLRLVVPQPFWQCFKSNGGYLYISIVKWVTMNPNRCGDRVKRTKHFLGILFNAFFFTTCYDPGWPEVDDILSTRKFVSGSLGSAWSLRVSFRGPEEKIVHNVRLPSVIRWSLRKLSFWLLDHFLLGLHLFSQSKQSETARISGFLQTSQTFLFQSFTVK